MSLAAALARSQPRGGRFFISRRAYATKEPAGQLNWPQYLEIRSAKRKWETATTIPSTLLGFGTGVAYFGQLEGNSLIMGVEPLYIYSAAALGCCALGYLIGPMIGSTFWRLTHRRAMTLIEARDREFHQHIVRNRVDPAAQTATNPVPDFYGEKIGSLHQYRQWLRDQSRYRRKALWPED